MTSQYHYGIYSQNRAAEIHILHKFTPMPRPPAGALPLDPTLDPTEGLPSPRTLGPLLSHIQNTPLKPHSEKILL